MIGSEMKNSLSSITEDFSLAKNNVCNFFRGKKTTDQTKLLSNIVSSSEETDVSSSKKTGKTDIWGNPEDASGWGGGKTRKNKNKNKRHSRRKHRNKRHSRRKNRHHSTRRIKK